MRHNKKVLKPERANSVKECIIKEKGEKLFSDFEVQITNYFYF